MTDAVAEMMLECPVHRMLRIRHFVGSSASNLKMPRSVRRMLCVGTFCEELESLNYLRYFSSRGVPLERGI